MIIIFFLLQLTYHWCFFGSFMHTDDVYQASYSPDGSKIVIASKDGKNYIYNARTMAVQYPYDPGQKAFTAKYSPSGSYIAFGLTNDSVIILDSSYGFVAHITTTFGDVQQVDFSANNDKLIVCGRTNNDGYQIFSVPGWSLLHSDYTYTDEALSCRFANDGHYAVGSKDGYVRYYDSSYNEVWNNQVAADIPALTFSPDSSYLLVSWSTTLKQVAVFDVSSNTPISYFTTVVSSVYGVDWSSDGTMFAYGYKDNDVCVNNGTTPSAFTDNLFTFTQASSDIYSVDFSPDSQWLVAGVKNNQVMLFRRDCTPYPIHNQQYCPAQYYQDSNTTCRFCALDIVGCRKCTNNSVCLECTDQYYLSTTTNLCMLCIDSLTACVQCENSSACLSCLESYYQDSGSCLNCYSVMDGCTACSNSSVCLSCAQKTHYLSSNSCVKCSQSDPFCINCNSTTCFLCVVSYFILANGSCSSCPFQCSKCTDFSTCQGCSSGFYLSGTQCLLCNSPCLSCSSSVLCESCIQGYYLSGSNCLACDQKCSICSASSTNCQACNSGFYLSGSTCTSCTNSCKACINSTYCLSCSSGFFLQSSTNTCLDCPSLFPSCHLCTDSQCLQCSPGMIWNGTNCLPCSSSILGCQLCQGSNCILCLTDYYLDGSSCSSCLHPCLSCSSNTSCISCVFGYYFDGTNSCLQCPCPSCSSSTFCTSCQLGKYLDNGTCIQCSSLHYHCLSCFDGSTCNNCNPPFFLSSGNCTRCPQGCTSCNSSACFNCDLGFFLNGVSCDRCSPLCSECSSSINCSQCLQGSYLDSSNSCISCQLVSQGCIKCNSSDCFSCNFLAGYFLSSSYCSLCSSSLSSCLSCTDSLNCQICQPTFVLNSSSQCQSCQSLIPNCQNCLNSSACVLCTSGFYSNSDSSCLPCQNGCFLCTNGTECTKCFDEYFLNSSSLCVECAISMTGCQKCTSSLVCSSCTFGFYIDNNNCLSCLSALNGCLQCSNSSACQICQSGYFLNSSAQCLLCSSNITGCAFCVSNTQCDRCVEGYFLSGNACILCTDPDCVNCNSSSCLQCRSGSFLNSNGSCQLCSTLNSSCLLCNSSECFSCQNGNYLSSGNCLKCSDSNCELCNSFNSSQCFHCNSNYFLSNGSCLLCTNFIANCLTCSTASCVSCLSGYHLQGAGSACTTCNQTFPNCRMCTISACTACSNGYYLSVSTCQSCFSLMQGCSLCFVSTVCESCLQGYYLNTTTQLCQLCTLIENCLICHDNDTCQACESTHYLTNGTCYSCNQTQGCIMCDSSTVCTLCSGSYRLQGSACSIINTDSSYEQFKLISKYQNTDTLSHTLFVIDGQFTYSDIDLILTTEISYLSQGSIITLLTITHFQWGYKYQSIIFYTNNPFDFTNQNYGFKNMNFVSTHRRLLYQSKINPNVNFILAIQSATVGTILPTVTHGGTLQLSYNINSPQFISSLMSTQKHYYFIFGWLVTFYLFLFYFIKRVLLDHQSKDKGQIIAHILFTKTPALMVYPSYSQLISYCSGFMIADLPWLNKTFGTILSRESDTSPDPYRLFYTSMSIASTFLLPLMIISLLFLVFVILMCSFQNCKYHIKNLMLFFYCFFLGGMSFAFATCVQGAFLNFHHLFTLNFIFYLLGIISTFILFGQALWSCFTDNENIFKLRIMAKAAILSVIHYNPLPLYSITIFFQIFFISYQWRHANIKIPKFWLSINILSNINTFFLVLFSSSLLMIYTSMILIITTLVIDFIRVHKQANLSIQIKDEEQKVSNNFDINQICNEIVIKQRRKNRNHILPVNFNTTDQFIFEEPIQKDVQIQFANNQSEEILNIMMENTEN